MKPAAFDYVAAADLYEALDALREDDARVIAGGQSLVPMLNMRLATPRVLVDITGIKALDSIETTGAHVTVGAGVRQVTLEQWSSLSETLPLVRAAFPWVGHAQTRSRGTICGSIAHADPSAELPLCLVASKGTVLLRSRQGKREVAAADFFLGTMLTDIRPGEMITAIRVPKSPRGAGHAFNEVARRHGDFAIVACAAVAGPEGTRLAVGGVADMPAVLELEDGDDLEARLNDFAWGLGARDDLHATARYRRDLVRRLGRKTIEEARRCRA